ncbi:amidohydrolase family protein [Rhabdobacter roseus]|uniref:Imidazolonepropionase-like amidohydrolase/Tol biopolymer transport system component n=1 Tax=Rhabdobacter roseus TaxID=1655419 RepID=A0A840TW10_9BACT|nr:amidohydrolase family protein [Rhabdobacter roseus]MBB5284348.1 imidazolonepropionase-like amidohydrolase/Tol biopolymer transport system component [Rhabdobacter roseus]
MKITILTALCWGIGILSTLAQDKKKWNVSQPEGTFQEVSFSTTEGTWMSLDVSPDGREIVFDLLGDLYTLPIEGGPARLLRGGHAFEVQPRYSPDGTQILFTSDAGGGENSWVMHRDGSQARPVTTEDFRLINNATWTPDGQYIVARKHFTSQRSLGAGEMWLYHLHGGKGLQLTKRKNDQQDVNEPCVSPDGRYVYYSEDMYPGGYFQYNKDPNNQIFVIKRLDRQKGTTETVTGGMGGAFRPQLSRDGKMLAFVRRVRTQTVLYLHNLETGEEWPLYDKLSKDQQEAWSIYGLYTGFAWTPDNRHLVIWANGKIHKVSVEVPNQSVEIPFTAPVQQRVYDALRFKQDISPERFKVNALRGAVTSPDGQWLVFNAVGYLWKKKLPDGPPERLTQGLDFESEAAFSPDGTWLTYVSWNDEQTGALWKLDWQRPGSTPQKLTSTKGIYRTPAFSPDGQQLVFVKEGDDGTLGNAYTTQPGMYRMAAQPGAAQTFVRAQGTLPRFNAQGTRIYYQTGGGLSKSYESCTPDGSDEQTHLKSKYGSQFCLSPDGQWVAFVDLHKVYVGTFPQTGAPLDIGSGTSEFPLKVVAKDAGTNLHWSGDGRTLHYTLGSQYFSIKLEDRFGFVANKPDSLFQVPEKGLDVALAVPADQPPGTLAFTNATIITMKGNEVIQGGTLVVEGNRIVAVGRGVRVPAGAKVIDCRGKTLMPGLIDAHAHANHFRQGLTPQKHWPYYANLAYGVTSMHDPSANTELVFAQSELVKAGKMVGPRVFSTGTILYGAESSTKAVINSLDDARSAIRRTQAYGAFSVKSYNQPRREQRQMIIQAARELGVMVVPEGGSSFYNNITMILDGHTTIEHNLPVATLHQDVIELWKRAKTAYTPTLIVNFGSVSGEYYWYQHTNVWEKERLLRFTPRAVIDSRARHRTMLPEEEYQNGHILTSQSCKKLTDAGVKVNMGAHGQIQGLGAHWEMWMLAQGGMSPHEVLRAATLNPAQSLGLDTYLGSLEAGKLADLLVLDKNPLQDIKNTESIRYTMVNGRLYDAETLHETGHTNQPRTKFYWENVRFGQSFHWHQEAHTHEGCSCGQN